MQEAEQADPREDRRTGLPTSSSASEPRRSRRRRAAKVNAWRHGFEAQADLFACCSSTVSKGRGPSTRETATGGGAELRLRADRACSASMKDGARAGPKQVRLDHARGCTSAGLLDSRRVDTARALPAHSIWPTTGEYAAEAEPHVKRLPVLPGDRLLDGRRHAQVGDGGSVTTFRPRRSRSPEVRGRHRCRFIVLRRSTERLPAWPARRRRGDGEVFAAIIRSDHDGLNHPEGAAREPPPRVVDASR